MRKLKITFDAVMRESYTGTSKVIASVPAGKIVTLLNQHEDYLQVQWGSLEGWISSKYVSSDVSDSTFSTVKNSSSVKRKTELLYSAYKNKFPYLNRYQNAIRYIAYGTMILGSIGAFVLASSFQSFSFPIFLGSLLAVFSTAGSLLINSDLLRVFVRIENHLEALVNRQYNDME